MRLLIILVLVALSYSCGKDDSNAPAPVVEEEEEPRAITRTVFLHDDQLNKDQCDVFEVNDEENCYVEYARLDIYNDGSRVLELRWFHIAADGSNDEGETFTGQSEPDDEYVSVQIDSEFNYRSSDGTRMWATVKKRSSVTDTTFLTLYHDTDHTATLDIESDTLIDALVFDY